MPRVKRLVIICPNKCHTVMKKRPVAVVGNRAFFLLACPLCKKMEAGVKKHLQKFALSIIIIYYIDF